MSKLRKLIFLLLIAGTLWHFYGETYQQSGVQGVISDVQSDFHNFTQNPKVSSIMDTVKQEIHLLYNQLTDNEQDNKPSDEPNIEKPELDTPSEQTFSIHNVEIGDSRSQVEEQVGPPQRSSLNEYGVDWVTYHENYQNFFMASYDDHDQVVGLYTNQDLITSTQGITLDSSKETVLTTFDEPLRSIRKGFVNYQVENTGDYHTFQIDQNYVTIFYDKHDNHLVSAIQIIHEDLENQKEKFYGKPSDLLKEGFEYQLFDLTNAARAKYGIPTLTWDEAVRTTAQDHSKDMAENNYFSHNNLEGQSPFDRMTEDNIEYRMAGENLAAGQTSSIFAHEGLMNSYGHRENKLKEEFTSLAVGVGFGTDDQPYFTENYITR
ncbi:CAP domain-containing protein [Oceanobacillus halotolerans]|uniref:CAP domain-containing protein n=1 Tax=Oceanobacillus halotolerans TaxID=2663380 RepID=UPI0013DAAC8C|nr:CAP-associated domain-containing protein [Oceanobacillus halotolerans]